MEKLIPSDSVAELQKLDNDNLREVDFHNCNSLLGYICPETSCWRFFGNDGDVHGLSSRHG